MVWVEGFDKIIGILRSAKGVDLSICVAKSQISLPLEFHNGHTWFIGCVPQEKIGP